MLCILSSAGFLTISTCHTYILCFYKQSRKTWYEHCDNNASAELFGKHTQTIVNSRSSSKIAKVISTVELEGCINWVDQASLLCLILLGISGSDLGMEYRVCLFHLQMAIGWTQQVGGQNSNSKWSWLVRESIWKTGCSSIWRN